MDERNSTLALVPPELQQEVEQFLFAEASLLDRRAYRDWFNLLAPDLRYRMPLRFNREKRERGHEYSKPDESCLFDETKASIDMRIKRLETGMAWAEEPPSRTRHMVTNVRIWPTAKSGELNVSSYFHLYRSRLERQVDQFLGERNDVLRRADNPYGFVIAAREIHLDQSTVLANNLSVFF
jgi:3-phenylpropionate/cinnamic acid dioxygenase small subunit